MQINEYQEKMYEMEAKIETLKRQETNMNDKMSRLRIQGELKKEAAEAALKACKVGRCRFKPVFARTE